MTNRILSLVLPCLTANFSKIQWYHIEDLSQWTWTSILVFGLICTLTCWFGLIYPSDSDIMYLDLWSWTCGFEQRNSDLQTCTYGHWFTSFGLEEFHFFTLTYRLGVTYNDLLIWICIFRLINLDLYCLTHKHRLKKVDSKIRTYWFGPTHLDLETCICGFRLTDSDSQSLTQGLEFFT